MGTLWLERVFRNVLARYPETLMKTLILIIIEAKVNNQSLFPLWTIRGVQTKQHCLHHRKDSPSKYIKYSLFMSRWASSHSQLVKRTKLNGTIMRLLNGLILLFRNPEHRHVFQTDEWRVRVDNLTGRTKTWICVGQRTLWHWLTNYTEKKRSTRSLKMELKMVFPSPRSLFQSCQHNLHSLFVSGETLR